MKVLKGISGKSWVWLLAGLLAAQLGMAQRPGRGISMDGQGRPMGNRGGGGGDSLQHRDDKADSITIFYRYFDSSRIHRIDSSVNSFHRFPLPPQHIWLGSLGQPSRSLLFSPNMKPGFDAGFHGYDVFRFGVEDTRFFQTTRPYSELDYVIGGQNEQTIRVLHTQNINPVWNAAFEFRYVNSPGNFKNQNTSQGSLRLSSNFSTRNRRYSGFVIAYSNRNKASQNGGILSDSYLDTSLAAYEQRFNIPTRIGGDTEYGANIFSTNVATGHDYRQRALFFRHQYDFGQKDSSINAKDSSVIRYFYPRLRLQHQISFSGSYYEFHDEQMGDPDYDSSYLKYFGLAMQYRPDSLRDQWRDLTNEAAAILFPQKDNQDQFLKMGAGLQLLQGKFDTITRENYSNLYLLGEYRNRTKNRRWDINAFGRLYLGGLNAGDYTGSLNLQTQLGKKAGTLMLGFTNTNRSPSFVFDTTTSYFLQGPTDLKNENWTQLRAAYYLPGLRLKLSGNYYLVSNYTFLNSYSTFEQEATLQSVLHLGAEKVIRLSRRWNWYAELHVQQATGSAINLPAIYTRHRIAYEGVLYKNLNLSTGVELRYFTPFKADDWSPFNGQWVTQNSTTISNRPDIAAYLHFRIRSLRVFGRAENLNTLDISRGFGFLANNHAAPLYPTPGLIIRVGLYWGFVN